MMLENLISASTSASTSTSTSAGGKLSCPVHFACYRIAPEYRHVHRLGWIRLGYREITEEFRVPSDNLESLHFYDISIEISLV